MTSDAQFAARGFVKAGGTQASRANFAAHDASASPYEGYGRGGHAAHGSHAARPAGGGRGSGGGRRHRGLAIALVVILVIVALLLALAIVGVRAVNSARDKAQTLVDDARAVASQVQSGGASELGQTLSNGSATLSRDVSALKQEIDGGFVWSIAAALPGYGQDVKAARALVDAADVLVNQVMSPSAKVIVEYPVQQVLSGSTVNTAAVQAYCSLIDQIQPSVASASATLEGVSAPHVSQVNDAIAQISEPLSKVSDALEQAEPVVDALPGILGANGTRTYLVVALNNSEIRSLDGMPGAMMAVTVDNGAIEFGDVYNASEFGNDFTGAEQLALTDEEFAAFGSSPGNMIQNVNFIPDFPRVCELLNQYWERDYGTTYDGIVALDVPMLQYIVAATGIQVQMSDGTVLNGETTNSVLLHDVYVNYPEEGGVQDAYFVEAADSIMSSLFDISLSNVDLTGLVDTVRQGIDEGHMYAWMSDASEQSAMERLGLDGAVSHDAQNPVLNVYLDDSTYSKIDWYLRGQTTVEGSVANADGSTTYTVSTSLTNTMDWEGIASGEINAYIYGYNAEKADEGDMLTRIYLLAPEGATIESVDTSAFSTEDTEYGSGTLYGRQILWGMVHTEPGETTTVTYTITVPAGAAQMDVEMTPTMG